jgi:hypothetical protein
LSKRLTIDAAVLKRLRRLSKAERTECLLALCELPESFGQPHLHGGFGIRKLANKLFEFRGNLELRFIFQNRADDLFISFPGNHDEVRALLQRGKYR